MDASKLTVEITGIYSRGTYKGVVKGVEDFLVHGNVVVRRLDGSYRINSEDYNFDFKPITSVGSYVRNVETDWGRHVAGYSTHKLEPFTIHFKGTPNIDWNL